MFSKKNLYRWHKRLGLTLGFVMLLLALSGIAITFRDELLPMTYPRLMRVNPGATRAPLVEQLKAAKAALPNENLTHLYTAERDDTSSMIFYRPRGAWLPHLLAIDPYTNEVKGHMPLFQNIFGVMLYMHANLFLGKIGGFIVGFMGLVLTFFFVSGVVLWWPKTDWNRKLKGLLIGVRGFHRLVGLAFGLPLLFSALTGFILAFDILQPIGRLAGHAKKPTEMVDIFPCNFEQQLKALQLLTPCQQANLVSIHFCNPKNGLMKFSYGLEERSGHHGYSRIVVDPRSMKVVQQFNTSTDPTSWTANQLIIYPLHTGEEFGVVGKIINVLGGFALISLFFTGLWPSIRRKSKF